jgi:ABC-2 type transport system permease protein
MTRRLRHAARIFARTFSVSVGVMLAYRANLVFFLLFETLFLAAKFLTVRVGFDLAGGDIAGWTRDQAYLLTAVNGLSHQLFICFFISPIFNVGMQVWSGQFDYLLLKPVTPLASMWAYGQIVTSNLPNLVINSAAVVYLVAKVGSGGGGAATPGMLAAFALFFLVGAVVRVAMALLCMAPAFLSERLADAEDTFWGVTSLAQYPMSVYPRALELGFTFLLPLAMIASTPSSLLFGREGLGYMMGALAASLVFIVVAVRAFYAGVARYQSVNSGV